MDGGRTGLNDSETPPGRLGGTFVGGTVVGF